MDESPPYHLDIEGVEDSYPEAAGGPSLVGRPWVGIRFDCCGVYVRAYRTRDGVGYRATCPRCMGSVSLRIGPDGTSSRFFKAE